MTEHEHARKMDEVIIRVDERTKAMASDITELKDDNKVLHKRVSNTHRNTSVLSFLGGLVGGIGAYFGTGGSGG